MAWRRGGTSAVFALLLGIACQHSDPIGALRPRERFPLGRQTLSIALAREEKLDDLIDPTVSFTPLEGAKELACRSWEGHGQGVHLTCYVLLPEKATGQDPDLKALSAQLPIESLKATQMEQEHLDLNGLHWQHLVRYQPEPVMNISVKPAPEDPHPLLYAPKREGWDVHERIETHPRLAQDLWVTRLLDGRDLIIVFVVSQSWNQREDALAFAKKATLQIERVIESVRLE
ncbi:MAG TPA: hypothetical protein VJ483_08625 [Holophagaceae bacterium]|nr:hypothetical protein [Holophagaceae bacterium]